MLSYIKRSYYKLQIIITFSIVAIALVLTASRVSYVFVKNLYLDELNEHVKNIVQLLGNQVDNGYLRVLTFGKPSPTVQNSFQNLISKNNIDNSVEEVFIFDKDFGLIVHSNRNINSDQKETSLLLNKTEINSLDVRESSTSLPFKGEDGNWYMWGFFKLNNEYYLAARENASRLERVEDFSLIFWYIGFGGVLITIIASWIIANKITSPINRLITFSELIGSGKFETESPGEIKGEIRQLSRAMDKMKNGLAKNQKEKEEMLAQIAHEIRNPLGGIELLANLTKEDLIKNNADHKYIDKILNEVYSLKDAITNYLNYSKPARVESKFCDLESVFDEIKSITTKNVEKKNSKIRFSFEFDKVNFDPLHLKNVLLNLVTNSIDSISENGCIEILSKIQNGSKIISVKDTGKGIPTDKTSKIFNPFFTTKSDGTGLGLAISKKLCSENNAELVLESSSENGSTFSIIKSNE